MIAGTTGSGKSVGINGMILSILYKFRPDECRLIMVDPKMIELSVYDGIPHLLTPVITNPKKAVVGLKWVVREMDDRYNRMSKLSVRTMEAFNTKQKITGRRGKSIKGKFTLVMMMKQASLSIQKKRLNQKECRLLLLS